MIKSMRVLIIEDEKAAARNLKALIEDVAPQCDIVAIIDSVNDVIEWIDTNPLPDLMFMDIHLADGSVFEIFEEREVMCPIIFTTAYDEYAIKAFRVNSIDYLLKPISAELLHLALDKYSALNMQKSDRTGSILADIRNIIDPARKVTTHFLVPMRGDKLFPLSANTIRYFYISEGIVIAVNDRGDKFTMPNTLDELSQMIDSERFFRANRQFIITREAIEDIDLWFNNRLSVNLKGLADHRILISRIRVNDFRSWFSNNF